MKEPKDYYEAARERLDQARFLFDVPQEEADRALGDKRYALVVYAAGVAVEALLRAYRLKVDDTFDGRHNLDTLFGESGLDAGLREHLEGRGADPAVVTERLRELRTAVGSVYLTWRNVYRYASDRALVKDLIERKRIPRSQNKGDKAALLRAQARILIEAATVVIAAGEEAWS